MIGFTFSVVKTFQHREMAYEMTHVNPNEMKDHRGPMPHIKPSADEPVTRDELAVYDALSTLSLFVSLLSTTLIGLGKCGLHASFRQRSHFA